MAIVIGDIFARENIAGTALKVYVVGTVYR